MKVQATAKLNKLRMSPRKVRMVIDMIRQQPVALAEARLAHITRAAVLPVKKLLQSAVANATHNHNMDESTVMIKEAYVDSGPIMYRWMPRAFGRASKIRKRTSHITLVLEGMVKSVTEATPAQTEEAPKELTKKTTKKVAAKTSTKKVVKK